MSDIDLEDAVVATVEPQEPVQEWREEGEGPVARVEGVGGEEVISCTYLSVVLHEPLTYKGYTVRRAIDPEKWDYAPEEDCRRDWDELEG